LICGSALLAEETQRWFQMIGIPVYQVYGLTETTAIVTMDEPGREVPGKVGHAIACNTLKVGPGDELLVLGDNVFAGYWNRPAASAEAFVEIDGERWFRTGDQVEIDTGGNVKIVGRVKNVLVPSSGHNVAPEPIEQALLDRVPALTHAVVVGHGKPFLVAIVAGPADRAEIERAIAAVNETLPHYKRVRSFFATPEPFTIESGLLTANQKLRRKVIEAHFRAELEALYRS
jgi:long-chain acyl-CoA synthetase